MVLRPNPRILRAQIWGPSTLCLKTQPIRPVYSMRLLLVRQILPVKSFQWHHTSRWHRSQIAIQWLRIWTRRQRSCQLCPQTLTTRAVGAVSPNEYLTWTRKAPRTITEFQDVATIPTILTFPKVGSILCKINLTSLGQSRNETWNDGNESSLCRENRLITWTTKGRISKKCWSASLLKCSTNKEDVSKWRKRRMNKLFKGHETMKTNWMLKDSHL